MGARVYPGENYLSKIHYKILNYKIHYKAQEIVASYSVLKRMQKTVRDYNFVLFPEISTPPVDPNHTNILRHTTTTTKEGFFFNNISTSPEIPV